MKNFFEEFKAFISRGNVIDMAVGIIMGSAFTAIVDSLVKQVVMPAIGFIIGGVNFADFKIVLKPAAEGAEEVAVLYGAFIQQIISFIIIAFVVFLMVKAINSFRKKEEKAPAATPEPSEEIVTLREIRDLLSKK